MSTVRAERLSERRAASNGGGAPAPAGGGAGSQELRCACGRRLVNVKVSGTAVVEGTCPRCRNWYQRTVTS